MKITNRLPEVEAASPAASMALEQHVPPDWLQPELVRDARPQVALPELGAGQEDRRPASLKRAPGGIQQQMRLT